MPYNSKDYPAFNAVSDKCVLKRDKDTEKTEGGILMPDLSKKKTWSATVLAVGPGSQRSTASKAHDMVDVKPGDRVIVDIYNGINLKLDNESYLFTPIKNIMALVVES